MIISSISQAEHADSGSHKIFYSIARQHFSLGFRGSLFLDTPFLMVFRDSFSVIEISCPVLKRLYSLFTGVQNYEVIAAHFYLYHSPDSWLDTLENIMTGMNRVNYFQFFWGGLWDIHCRFVLSK